MRYQLHVDGKPTGKPSKGMREAVDSVSSDTAESSLVLLHDVTGNGYFSFYLVLPGRPLTGLEIRSLDVPMYEESREERLNRATLIAQAEKMKSKRER